MLAGERISLLLTGAFLLASCVSWSVKACCPAPPSGKAVVNADQTVIIVWDAATKTEHFIRQPSFKSEADDFGFIIPTPSQPILDESGKEAFGFLARLTAPSVRQVPSGGGMGCGCGREMSGTAADTPVRILEEKTVAGFNAVVLEADSPAALVNWLKNNGYAYSPEVQVWAKPYVDAGWKITALKVAKNSDRKDRKNVAASALYLSFKTDRPLFPYREPDYKASAEKLGAADRLLRIYFLAESRYQGDLDKQAEWTGTPRFANTYSEESRKRVLELLKLPETTGPAKWWLTEFEDRWPYKLAPADLYFSPSPDQGTIKRPPIIQYVSTGSHDLTPYALAVVAIAPGLIRRVRPLRALV